jgi:glycosyltransferase involved in cell wall biosynthesis
MKIAIFDFVTHLGGAQKSITEFAVALHRLGYSVHFIDAYGAVQEHEIWIRQSELPYLALHRHARYVKIGYEDRPLYRLLRAIKALPELFVVRNRLRKFLEKHQLDVVVVTAFKSLKVLLSAAKGINIKIVYWCRGRSVPDSVIKSKVVHRVDIYLCLSNSIRQDLIDKGLPEKKVYVVQNAIDIKELTNKAKMPMDNELPDYDKPVRILIPATLLPSKGQDCAIRVLARMVEREVDAILYLAGDSTTNDLSYRQRLIKLSNNLGVGDRVYFLGWRRDIPQIMKRSTLVMLPSHTEGTPRCVMEAMALKVPVIATPVGGVSELLDGGEGGTLVKVDDHDGIAEAVLQGLNGSFAKRTDFAYISALKKFDRKTQLNTFLQIVRYSS